MEYVALCDPYCGDAHRRALSAGSAVNYKCHAGLQCFTMPVHIGGEQNLAAIGGRAANPVNGLADGGVVAVTADGAVLAVSKGRTLVVVRINQRSSLEAKELARYVLAGL